MSLQTRLTDLATRIATECKALRTLINGNAANLSALNTTAKSSLVAALNEVQAAAAMAAAINDAATGTGSVWSSSKTSQEISAAVAAVVNGAGAALDTLNELAAALGNDANFASSTATALANRIRVDTAQTLNTAQQLQACQNLGIGDPETNFVTTFNAGLV